MQCRSDIRYGPAINTWPGRRDIRFDVEVLPSPTDERVTRHRVGNPVFGEYDLNPKLAAVIQGTGHQVKLHASEDLQLREDDPHYVVVKDASDVFIENETSLPVALLSQSENVRVVTSGPVALDDGTDNVVDER
jgi:hypothetical protein